MGITKIKILAIIAVLKGAKWTESGMLALREAAIEEILLFHQQSFACAQ